MEDAINSTREEEDPRTRSPQAKQLTRSEGNSTYQQIIRLKFRVWTCPPEQVQFFLLIRKLTEASSTRGQTEVERRTTIPQMTRIKQHYRKLIRMKKQRVMPQMKG